MRKKRITKSDLLASAGVGLGFMTARRIVPTASDGFNPLPETASFCRDCGALVAESGRTPRPVDLSFTHKCGEAG